MRKWKGLQVPVEPEKSWKWMKDHDESCCGDEIPCFGTCCEDCIYSRIHADARASFYTATFEKEEKMFEWEGLKVPLEPKREWGSWMTSNEYCPIAKSKECASVEYCKDCVYSQYNRSARRCFYEQYYGKWPSYEEYFMGLRVPFPPEKGWVWDSCSSCCVARHKHGTAACAGVKCRQCIYHSANEAQYAAFYSRSFNNKSPKLTVEVFNRPDCPEWAQWAAVDASGKARFFSRKPLVECRFCSWYTPWRREEEGVQLIEDTKFDPTNWKHSLIERPQKELPKLTQTAFHCPDCPKEATKLTVFPTNHVVALDKDNKVLSVMELQCKEGEINRFKVDWYYDYRTNQLYYGPDQCVLPITAKPAKVAFLPAEELVGKAVTDQLTAKTVVITRVGNGEVDIVGVTGSDIMSMVTLVTRYRFTANRGFCCTVDTHAVN